MSIASLFDRLRVARVERQQRRDIDRVGWSGVYVGDYRHAPTWAYTIGFDETLGGPEIVVFDVPKASANNLFNRVFRELRSGELKLHDGLVWPPEGERRFVWRKVHEGQIGEWLTLAWARRLLQTGKAVGLEAYQFVLPDPEGVLPWEPGYLEALRPRQHALWLAPNEEVAADGGV